MVPRPRWIVELSSQTLWARDEVIPAVCGEDPEDWIDGVADAYGERIDRWTNPDCRRAARLVDRAVQAGELRAEIIRATVHYPVADYFVRRDDAIRWALERREMFPRFPFTDADLPAGRSEGAERLGPNDSSHEALDEAVRQTAATVTPLVVEWKQVQIHFTSDHRLQLTTPLSTETLSYADLGFEDRRTRNPTKAWETLLALARARGSLLVPIHDRKHLEKRIQEITRILQRKVGARGRPILYLKKERVYRAGFVVGTAAAAD